MCPLGTAGSNPALSVLNFVHNGTEQHACGCLSFFKVCTQLFFRDFFALVILGSAVYAKDKIIHRLAKSELEGLNYESNI